jgi:hypothetical protein
VTVVVNSQAFTASRHTPSLGCWYVRFIESREFLICSLPLVSAKSPWHP